MKKNLFYVGVFTLSTMLLTSCGGNDQRNYGKELKNDLSATKSLIKKASSSDELNTAKNYVSSIRDKANNYLENNDYYLSIEDYTFIQEEIKELNILIDEKNNYELPKLAIKAFNELIEKELKEMDKYEKDVQKYLNEAMSYLKKTNEAFTKKDMGKAVDNFENFSINAQIAVNLLSKLDYDTREKFESTMSNLGKEFVVCEVGLLSNEKQLNDEQKARVKYISLIETIRSIAKIAKNTPTTTDAIDSVVEETTDDYDDYED